MSNKQSKQSKLDSRESLQSERNRCAEEVAQLEKQQLAGDFSIELSRQISTKRYHIEVLTRRINGEFTNDISPVPMIPEGRGIRTGNYRL